MGYYIDLSTIELNEYKKQLATGYLLPSRMLLKDNIEVYFDRFRQQGIATLEQLQLALKTKSKLEKLKIKTTVQLFDKIDTPEKRVQFAINHSISKKELLFLTKLTDVSRLRWVGSTFAYVLVKSGYDSVKKNCRCRPS